MKLPDHVIKAIHSSQNCKTLFVEFGATGPRFWLDGAILASLDWNMLEFFTDVCSLCHGDAKELVETDWQVLDIAEEETELFSKCFGSSGLVFNKALYKQISENLADREADMLLAAIECEINLDDLEDKFIGEYESFTAFVEERWTEGWSMQLPKEVLQYIDFEKIATDWDAEGNYTHHNGFVFYAD